jgi:protein TonB
MVENKKNPKADLSRTTGLFFNVGLVLSLLIVIFAFEKKVYDDGSEVNLEAQAEDFEDLMDIPQTHARGRRIRGVTSHEIAVTGAWT